jgi:hypothetical protein
MSKKTKLILYFATNILLPVIAIAVIILGRLFAQSSYTEYINCPSVLVFDVYCPFCGTTRAMSALLHGKILSAFIYNPAFVLFVPYFLYYDIKTFIHIIKNKEKFPNIQLWIIITLGTILITNWIFRNILLLAFNIDYLATLTL